MSIIASESIKKATGHQYMYKVNKALKVYLMRPVGGGGGGRSCRVDGMLGDFDLNL